MSGQQERIAEIATEVMQIWAEVAEESQHHTKVMKEIERRLNIAQAELSAWVAVSRIAGTK